MNSKYTLLITALSVLLQRLSLKPTRTTQFLHKIVIKENYERLSTCECETKARLIREA